MRRVLEEQWRFQLRVSISLHSLPKPSTPLDLRPPNTKWKASLSWNLQRKKTEGLVPSFRRWQDGGGCFSNINTHLEVRDMEVYMTAPTVHQKEPPPPKPPPRSLASQKDKQPISRGPFSCTHLWGRFFYRYDLDFAIIGPHRSVSPAKTMTVSTKVKDL